MGWFDQLPKHCMEDQQYTQEFSNMMYCTQDGVKWEQEVKPGGDGVKFDKGKNRVELLDPWWLEEVGAVLTFGAKKYADHNWRQGMPYTRLIGALLRHVFAIMRGEDRDPESGLTHAGHASCCLMFLFGMMLHRPDKDDRWRP